VERGSGVVVERANGARVETAAGFDHFKNGERFG
jgi:hypothetical protein